MKTTVNVGDSLFQRAKRQAMRDGVTLRELIENGLRRELDQRNQDLEKPFHLRRDIVIEGGVQPGIDLTDWNQIRDIIYEPRGIDPPPPPTKHDG